MPAIVCGKRSFLEESPSSAVSKRSRCSYSPSKHASRSILASSTPSTSLLLDRLISLFPNTDSKVLAETLGECSDDVHLAIQRLNEPHRGCANSMGGDDNQSNSLSTANNKEGAFHASTAANDQQQSASEDPEPAANLPKDGEGWVELFVKEMMSATHLNDARARAARALVSFEKHIGAGMEVQILQQDNTMLKGQIQVLTRENTILKRAVSIQHERQKVFDEKLQELQHLEQLIPQYQEQLSALEVKNYSLSMHLNQALQNGSFPGGLHPDIL